MSRTVNQEAMARRDRSRMIDAEVRRQTAILASIVSVEKVILFGSAASGRTGMASDIDLLVIQRTDKRFLDRVGELLELLQPNVATDLLVWTPEELERNSDSRFIRQIGKTRRVLYEKAA